MTTTEALGAWGAYDRDDPFPLFAAVRELGAGACGHARRRARCLARGRLRGGTDRAQRSAALQGHARRAGDRRRGRGRGPARTLLRAAHAQRRPAGSQPAAPPRLGRLHAAPRRSAPPARAGHRGRPARRDRRGRTGRADRPRRVRSRSRCRSPSSASCSACPSRIGPTWDADSPALLVPTSTPERVRTGQGGVRRGRGDARGARRRQAGQPRRRPRERARSAPATATSGSARRSCCRRSSS